MVVALSMKHSPTKHFYDMENIYTMDRDYYQGSVICAANLIGGFNANVALYAVNHLNDRNRTTNVQLLNLAERKLR